MNNPTDMTVTLHANVLMTSGVLGANGGYFGMNWNIFNDAATVAPLYKYFEVVSCRIRPTLATTTETADSFLGGAIAFVPINYWVEGHPTFAPVKLNQVNELPGSVFLQPGANNFGRWFNPRIKQQFNTVDAFLGSTPRPAGTLVWWLSDAGISEKIGECDIEVNVRFYQREYSSTVSLSEMKAMFDKTGRLYAPLHREAFDDSDVTIVNQKAVKRR
jgi:hypothetical protein